ncbi:MAG TPA: GHKL domain-containing protein [Gammaproteobacteria bacterium]|nr:GHKL domain-containing protein [Gammaproteobacteria bacterium]
MNKAKVDNKQPPLDTPVLVPPPDELSRHDHGLRLLFNWLSLISLALIFAVLAHEYFVLNSRPVEPAHALAHASLLVVTALLVAIVWLFSLAYRRMRAYQVALAASHAGLEDVVANRTRALRDSQALLETLFDSFRERTLVVDADNRIVRANRQASGDFEGTLGGRRLEDVYPDCAAKDERRTERGLIQHTFREKKPQRNRIMRGGADCDRVLSVDTYPVFSADGEVELVIEVVRDVTDIKYLELQHQHHDKMAALGLLAAGMAHNLGNPLASLSSELQLLKEETRLDRIRPSLEVLDREVRRMAESIHDIMGFARKRSDEGRRVSVEQTVNDTLRLLRHDPRAKNIRFETRFEPALPAIRFNENDLVLVLTNVLVNALDAIPSAGTIRVEASRGSDGDVRLVVIDDGQGMSPDVLEQATRPLFTTKGEASGTGLGLAIVDNIVRSSHGALHVDSAPGSGTTVTLSLPIAE